MDGNVHLGAGLIVTTIGWNSTTTRGDSLPYHKLVHALFDRTGTSRENIEHAIEYAVQCGAVKIGKTRVVTIQKRKHF